MTVVAEERESLPLIHQRVLSVMRVGKENATQMSDIMSITGIRDKRTAYQIIEELVVRYNYVIVASRYGAFKGYYIPADENELNDALKTIESEYKSIKHKHNKLRDNFVGA